MKTLILLSLFWTQYQYPGPHVFPGDPRYYPPDEVLPMPGPIPMPRPRPHFGPPMPDCILDGTCTRPPMPPFRMPSPRDEWDD